MNKYGVVIGDLVSSREISPDNRKKLYEDIRTFLKQIKKEKWIDMYDLSRGDTIQCLVKDIKYTLRVALMIRSYIISYITQEQAEKYKTYKGKGKIAIKGYFPGKQDIRISMGIGEVDFISEDLGQSDGKAFYLSSAGLEEIMRTGSKMIIKTGNEKYDNWLEPSILLLDAVIDKWTNNQAELVMYATMGKSEEQISEQLGISQSAVNQRKKTSQWYAVEKLLIYFETDIINA